MEKLRASVLRLLDHPRAPLAIVAVGLSTRLVALALLARTPLSGDANSYHLQAIEMLGGEPFEPHWPPGLPSLLAAGYLVLGASSLAGRALMLLVYLGFCAAVVGLGRRLGGPRVANLALAIFAVTPIFVWDSVNTLTELPAAALALGAVYFADRCRKGEGLVWSAGFLGLCFAGLLLTRPSNLSVVLVLPAYLAWKKARWQAIVAPLLVVTALTGAWCFKAYSMTGHPVLINNANSQNVFYGNNPWTPLYRTWWYGSHKEPGDMPPGFEAELRRINRDPRTRDAEFTRVALDHIEAHPGLFVVRTFNRVCVYFGFDTFTSAQLAKVDKKLGAVVLALDASLYLLVTYLAILLAAVVLSPAAGWAGLRKSTLPVEGAASPPDAGSAEAWSADRKELIALILAVALLYAAPYFLAFSHPTFHVPTTALVAMVGALAGVHLLGDDLGPIWRALGARPRRWLAAGLVAYTAIQIEWAIAVIQRVS